VRGLELLDVGLRVARARLGEIALGRQREHDGILGRRHRGDELRRLLLRHRDEDRGAVTEPGADARGDGAVVALPLLLRLRVHRDVADRGEEIGERAHRVERLLDSVDLPTADVFSTVTVALLGAVRLRIARGLFTIENVAVGTHGLSTSEISPAPRCSA
jgi:hypothetical protein